MRNRAVLTGCCEPRAQDYRGQVLNEYVYQAIYAILSVRGRAIRLWLVGLQLVGSLAGVADAHALALRRSWLSSQAGPMIRSM